MRGISPYSHLNAPRPRPNLRAQDYDNHKRKTPIARRPHNAPPVRDTGPRVNASHPGTSEIRLIGADGENVGVVSPDRGMELADQAGLDLVEISPNATRPR